LIGSFVMRRWRGRGLRRMVSGFLVFSKLEPIRGI
jgi:hypothetical protein